MTPDHISARDLHLHLHQVFDQHLQPQLALAGLQGRFAKKGGQVSEGLAVFWREGRLELLAFTSVFLPAVLQQPAYSYIWERVGGNEALAASLTQRTTELAIAVVRVVGEARVLVVGCTHLYYKPDADHVRLLQAELCLKELERVRREVAEEQGGCTVSVVLCGDFNSTPHYAGHMGGVLEYLTTGEVGEEHPDWRSREGEEVKGMHLSSSTTFTSAAGTPKYTNYTAGFKDCLDYIFLEKGSAEVVQVLLLLPPHPLPPPPPPPPPQVVPFPSEEELELHTAIPSIASPSDHLAVVVDVTLV